MTGNTPNASHWSASWRRRSEKPCRGVEVEQPRDEPRPPLRVGFGRIHQALDHALPDVGDSPGGVEPDHRDARALDVAVGADLADGELVTGLAVEIGDGQLVGRPPVRAGDGHARGQVHLRRERDDLRRRAARVAQDRQVQLRVLRPAGRLDALPRDRDLVDAVGVEVADTRRDGARRGGAAHTRQKALRRRQRRPAGRGVVVHDAHLETVVGVLEGDHRLVVQVAGRVGEAVEVARRECGRRGGLRVGHREVDGGKRSARLARAPTGLGERVGLGELEPHAGRALELTEGEHAVGQMVAETPAGLREQRLPRRAHRRRRRGSGRRPPARSWPGASRRRRFRPRRGAR